MRSPFSLAALLGAAAVTACGGGTSSGNQVSGSIVKGPVDQATVCAYELVASGKGRQLGCTVTRSDGSYTLNLDYTGPVVMEASGGNYTDEATGTPGVPLSAPLTTVGEVQSGANTLMATPLTTLAYRQAALGGTVSVTAFSQKAEEVKTAFDLGPEVDLSKTLPNVNPSQPNAYGTALIGVSKMLHGGASLAAISAAPELNKLRTTFKACSATPAVDIQVALTSNAPADGPVTLIDITVPRGNWRATLPSVGNTYRAACQVTINTASHVQLSCAPTTPVSDLLILANNANPDQSFDGPSNALPLAGDKIVVSGGPLLLAPTAPVVINGGGGGLRVLDIQTSGSLTIDDNGHPVIPPCNVSPNGELQPGGALSLTSPSGSITTGGSSGDVSLGTPLTGNDGSTPPTSDSAPSGGGQLTLSGSGGII